MPSWVVENSFEKVYFSKLLEMEQQESNVRHHVISRLLSLYQHFIYPGSC